MRARRGARGSFPGLETLHLVGLAGALLGLAEGVYHLFGPRPPAGIPGADGPSVAAYVALGMTAFLVPATVGALVSLRLRPSVATAVVWLFALLPTAFAYLDHLVHRRHVPGFAVDVGGAPHLARIGGLALLVATGCAAAGVGLSGRWSRRLSRARLGSLAGVSGPLWSFLSVVLLIGLLPPAGLPSGTGAEEDLPNVLLLSIDTLRQDALGSYGGPETPHLDDLIRSGVRADGWSCASWTRPAMAALFSGVVTTGNGAQGDRAVHREVDWWPERLRRAGYATQAIVTNPHLVRRFRFDRGFEGFEHCGELERLEPIALSVWAHWLGRQLRDRYDLRRGDRVVNRAIAWLEKASELDAPWFLWVHLVDPHLPYHVRGEQGELEPPEEPVWLKTLEGDLVDGRFMDLKGARSGTRIASDAAREALRRLYLREVRFADAQVGRLLPAATRAAGSRGLLWILVSDHGEEFWEHGSFEHGHSLHEEVLRVPLALGGAELPAGGVTEGMKLQDVGPTVLGLLGLPPLDPARGSGLAEGDSALARLALGQDRTELLREAAPASQRCAPPSMLAEGMLYGPEQTRLTFRDGVSFLRRAGEETVVVLDPCQDPGETNPRTVDCPPRVADILGSLDAWRQRTAEREEPVAIDPQLRRSLEALGYVD